MTIKLIKRGVTQRVVMLGDPIPLRSLRGRLNGASYKVVNTSSQVTNLGDLNIPLTGLTLVINQLDLNSINHSSFIQTLKAGDIITIGSASATLTGPPILNGQSYFLNVLALPVLTDGTYTVTVTIS